MIEYRVCLVCGEVLEERQKGRRRLYCSGAHRQVEARGWRRWRVLDGAIQDLDLGVEELPFFWRYADRAEYRRWYDRWAVRVRGAFRFKGVALRVPRPFSVESDS